MTTVNLEYAQQHLSELILQNPNGTAFIIERGGEPIARVTTLVAPPTLTGEREIGFLDAMFLIPEDIKAIDQEEIIALFEGNDDGHYT